jgi:hypothetical protein
MNIGTKWLNLDKIHPLQPIGGSPSPSLYRTRAELDIKPLEVESFEQVCRVALEAEGFAVSGNVKFFVKRRTKRKDRVEYQTHGYEVDLVGARSGKLVLAEVKSFLGSRGVSREGFVGLAKEGGSGSRTSLFKLFNDAKLRRSVVEQACELYGYKLSDVEMRLYVGKFAGDHERDIRRHFEKVKKPPVKVIGLDRIVEELMRQAESQSYLDDPVLVTVKALAAAGRLKEQ